MQGMLDLENPDLFKWLTGQEQPPSELEQNIAFQVLHSFWLQEGRSSAKALYGSEIDVSFLDKSKSMNFTLLR